MTSRGGILAALLAALGRPSWWLLALAGFLVRGGIVLFVLAIVIVPSPLALANILEPIVTPIYLGRLEAGTVALIVTGVASVVGWLVIGGWFAALTEVSLILDAREAALGTALASWDGSRASDPMASGRRFAGRAAAAHLVALIPAAFALGVGSIQVVNVAYRELVNPTDASPVVLRVLSGAAAPVIAIAVAWLLGEIVGGSAVRRIVVGGESVLSAVGRATLDLVRRPVGSLIVPILTTALLAVDLVAGLMVVSIAWSAVRSVLARPGDGPIMAGLALVGFGAAWSLALLVTGLMDAWRSAAMTFEVAGRRASAGGQPLARMDGGSRSDPSGSGTFGASAQRRPGEWSADDRGGSL